MSEAALPVVFAGHIDHGKSTLIGRLLYDTGKLKLDRLAEVEVTSSALGKETEFAFVLDSLEEEREKGITIDTTQIQFQTAKRPYLIIDAPGHKEFLKNMITGASYAEAAVLIIDANEGIREQTRRHAFLLSMVGIRDVCVAVNKMDLVGYSKETYQRLQQEIELLFSQFSTRVRSIVPIAALPGVNVAAKTDEMSWYEGPSLLDALDRLDFKDFQERPFRFPVQDIYRIGEETIVAGRVESGRAEKGMEVYIYPDGRKTVVTEIRQFLAPDRKEASYGQSIGLILQEAAGVKRGDVLAASGTVTVTKSFDANIFWFYGDWMEGETLTVKCATQESMCSIKIYEKFDPASMDVRVADPDYIQLGEAGRARIETAESVVVEAFSYIPTMGRVVFEKDGVPVGAGIVL